MNDLKITVEGKPGSGKSVVAATLASILKSLGANEVRLHTDLTAKELTAKTGEGILADFFKNTPVKVVFIEKTLRSLPAPGKKTRVLQRAAKRKPVAPTKTKKKATA